MKKVVIIAVVIYFGLFYYEKCSAISVNMDSLRIETRTLVDDTSKVIHLADLSKKYLKYQLDTSYGLAYDAVHLSKKLDYDFGTAYAYNQLGLVFKYLTEYDSALFYYNKSLEIFDALKVKSKKAAILNRIANVYKRQGKFDASLESFLMALQISKDEKDSLLVSYIYNNIGILYFDMGYYDKALEYQNLNLSLKEELKSTDNMDITLMNIGNIYSAKEMFEEAVEYYKQALVLLEKSGYKYDQLLLLHNMGVLYEENFRLKDAMCYYNKALAIEKEINEKEMRVYTIQGIGNVYIKSGNSDQGIQYLKKAFALAEEVGDLRKIHRLAANLYKEYERQGDYKNGFVYLKKYTQIEDSIYNVEGKKELIELEQKYEAARKEQQIEFLEKESEIQKLQLAKSQLESKQKSLHRNGLIIAIVLALISVIYFAANSKKRKKINLVLRRKNLQISDQKMEIVKQNQNLIESNKTKDKLFQIIAHDLRGPLISVDSITQLIPYWIEEQDYESLKKLSKTLEVSVNNVLTLIDNLLNWALSQQGKFPYQPENLKLKSAIAEAIDIYRPIAELKNVEVKFKMAEDIHVFADRNMFFTVMRNLLNNAVKYTPEGGDIIIGIENKMQFAKVWVQDSGIGISKEQKQEVFEFANGQKSGTKGETGKGLGLFFCKEFVTLNNGDIFIDSDYGKGTKITFTLPLFNIEEN